MLPKWYNVVCSLKYINVAMVTVLKNVTNVITALGEMYLFSKHHDNKVWAALFLMVCEWLILGFRFSRKKYICISIHLYTLGHYATLTRLIGGWCTFAKFIK